MLKHTLAITVAVAAISLAAPGTGSAGVACNPLCAPALRSNSGDDHLHGLNRANKVAGDLDGDHGDRGRDNAERKQDAHKPGGSGVVTSGGGTGGSTGGTGTGGGTPPPPPPPPPCLGC